MQRATWRLKESPIQIVVFLKDKATSEMYLRIKNCNSMDEVIELAKEEDLNYIMQNAEGWTEQP